MAKFIESSGFEIKFSLSGELEQIRKDLIERLKSISESIDKPLISLDIRYMKPSFVRNQRYYSVANRYLDDVAHEDCPNKTHEYIIDDIQNISDEMTFQVTAYFDNEID
ncbi:MAG: hypothetical protein Q4P13_05940 [Psychrobacter sp.]|nr:hypothetical protein [Psychrobacter sp.]